MPESEFLILIPTAKEHGLLFEGASAGDFQVEIIGFGLAAAGAGAARAIARHHPDRCILVGIGGSYDLDRAPIASVVVGDGVASWGIGIGRGENRREAATAGFPQVPGLTDDSIALTPWPVDEGARGTILSVASGSADAQEAGAAAAAVPGALVEEMEGWAVALACHATSTPLSIVRGISNGAGDRDHSRWRIAGALAAVRRAVLE